MFSLFADLGSLAMEIVGAVMQARQAASDGGKKVTRGERNKITKVAWERLEKIIDRALGELDESA